MPSNTDNTTREWRDSTSTESRDLYGSIRRMAITLTEGSFWRAVGHLLVDKTRETRDAEVFGTLGFYSRPAAGANAEAMLVSPGGSGNHVMIGTRDEDLRKRSPQLAQDSAIMRNRGAIVIVKPDNTIEARTPSGTAHGLATTDELNNLRAFVMQQFEGAGHGHGVSGAATNSTLPIVAPVTAPTTAYDGTEVLKGQ